MELVLSELDQARSYLPLLLTTAANVDSKKSANPLLALSQQQSRIDRLKAVLDGASNSLRSLRERVEASRGTLEHARTAYESDTVGIEPPKKRMRTLSSKGRALAVPNRTPVAYRPSLSLPTTESLVTFLEAAKSRFADLEMTSDGPVALRVTIKGIFRAYVVLEEREGTLRTARLCICALDEELAPHQTSLHAVFRLLSTTHSRPSLLEETLARLAALHDLFTAPCCRASCRKMLLPVPVSEMPVERILRAQGSSTPTFDAFHRSCWRAVRSD